MSFISSRGAATCRGTGQFLTIAHQNIPIPPRPTPNPGKLYEFGAYYPTLTQIGTDDDWLTGAISGPSSSGVYNIMIKSNGTMYGKGDNNYYQLGLGNTTNQNNYVQIGSANNWAWSSRGTISEGAFAITSDGNLYSWGYNYYGSLGQSNLDVVNTSTWFSSYRANITVPTQVPNVSGVIQVVQGAYFTAILKNDGTIWTCGLNQVGQLAIGSQDTSNVYPSFRQEITKKNNWRFIAASDSHLLAINSLNTLYMAGFDWQNGTPVYTTLTTQGLPSQPTGFVSVSMYDSGSFTAITPNNEIYCLGYNPFDSNVSFTTTWVNSGLYGYKTQIDGSYCARLTANGNIYLTSTSSSGVQLDSSVYWESFDYQGGYPGNSPPNMSWWIGN